MGFKIGKWEPGKTVSNIVSNPGKELGNAGKNMMGYVSPLYAAMTGGSGPKPPSAGEDPNVTALRQRLFGEAQQFEKDLPGMQAQAGNQIEAEGDMALQGGIKGARQSFNRRGLLYSGMRQGAEQDVKGRVASTMASQKTQSNQDLTRMATAKATKAAQVGLQGFQDSVNREAEIAGINLQNQVARAQMMQQIGSTFGEGMGRIYGDKYERSRGRTANADGAYDNFVGDVNQSQRTYV